MIPQEEFRKDGGNMSWEDFYKGIQEVYHIEDEATVIKIPFDNMIEITSFEDYGMDTLFAKNPLGTV